MNRGSPDPKLPQQVQSKIEQLCEAFAKAWTSGERPGIERYLEQISEDGRPQLLYRLVVVEAKSRETGLDVSDYRRRFPDYRTVIEAAFGELEETQWFDAAGTDGSQQRFHTEGGRDSATASISDSTVVPKTIGKYHVQRRLGIGGFGIVYVARHPQLEREVALKVPRSERFLGQEDVSRFLDEARNAARVKHPRIVGVYDVDRDGEVPFIVQEYIEGQDLGRELQTESFSAVDAARLVAEVAEAVAHAHQQGLYHRDLKPSNVLLDGQGRAHVADFGLALHESLRQDRRGERCGTPRYMAPEQVRGESHRLDGRCDIWSLGVILYEMLTGSTPFTADDPQHLRDEILYNDPQPPRQIKPQLPAELERICLKCLAKRMTERYTTAGDLASDLRHWLSGAANAPPADGRAGPLRVVPKGLRCFEDEDADFFLELLPGPRDRDGLPDAIRFWKTRIERFDPDRTFHLGLLYGSSGSGKSSFIKAGLLPRLSRTILPVYVEAAPADTELRVSREIRKQVAGVAQDVSLPDLLFRLRQGSCMPPGHKLLLVVDQFEQWLHARQGQERCELLEALRQCDGVHVQCLILVRDDFWMDVTRFLQALEVHLVQGHNVAAVDRFDLRHASKVLQLFGQAYGALPADAAEITPDQRSFVDQSIRSLADRDLRTVSVRLALFAEMVKDKPWTPTTLHSAGGAEGIGVSFLEERFTAPSANPRHRLHARAAQEVLQALLPAAGIDLKGHMKSYAELLAASPYAERKRDFDELMGILDSELRLITPTEPPASEPQSDESLTAGQQRFYQLTHDYVIPAVREWLSRKQKETRRGRAEIRLVERTALWTSKSERKQLPSWWEWLNILMYTRQRTWSRPQRTMMKAATRLHTFHGLAMLALLAVLLTSGFLVNHRAQQEAQAQRVRFLVNELWRIDLQHLPQLLDQLDEHHAVWKRDVTQVASDASRSTQQRTRAHIALARRERGSIQYLMQRMLEADAVEHRVIREELEVWKGQLAPLLWHEALDSALSSEGILRAAATLARYDPANRSWPSVARRVVQSLLTRNPLLASPWIEDLRPVRDLLMPHLVVAFRNAESSSSQRFLAASMIVNYGAEDTQLLPAKLLAELILDATPEQYSVLLPQAQRRRHDVTDHLRKELGKSVPMVPQASNERLLRRQANAAETLLWFDQSAAFWPLLKQSDDPRLRTLLIGRSCRPEQNWKSALARLDLEKDAAVRQAIVLGLDGLRLVLFDQDRDLVVGKVLALYRSDPDAGVHSAAAWLLRAWGYADDVEKIESQLAGQPPGDRHWFVNKHLQTMIVVRRPASFTIGSPEYEVGRDISEVQRTASIDYSFAISAHEVTVKQFLEYQTAFDYDTNISPHEDCPINRVSWYEAVKYCRWLSEQEDDFVDKQACYPKVEDIGPDMKLPDDYFLKAGYRLPTELEWEYAARAGSVTSRFFGDAKSQLQKHCWYAANAEEQTWPVGRLLPNPLGLFDVYGNVGEWCDAPGLDVSSGYRPHRGGDYRSTPKFLRSAMPNFQEAGKHLSILGFRLVKTMELD